MEVKTLLSLVGDDIAHLEAITREFNFESLPLPEEIEVALVRANALVKELELLHKISELSESRSKTIISSVECGVVDPEFSHLEEEQIADEPINLSDIPEQHQHDINPGEFSEVKKTLNETLGEPQQLVNDILSPGDGETGYQIIPINSIWDGIGINDRFLFIRELFANSSAKFENTVSALDKVETIHDAVDYLKTNFKWNKTEASQKFLVLVKRRFTNR